LEHGNDRRIQTLERVEDAFFAVDDGWNLTYVNEAGADVLREAMNENYTDSELIGRHLWTEVTDAVETDFEVKYRRAMETQEPVSFETRFDPMDVWFDVTAYPDDDGLSVYFTDITERREREEALREKHRKYENLAEGIRDGVYRADPDSLETTYVNGAISDIFGRDIDSWHDERGLWTDAVHPDDADEVATAFADHRKDRRDGSLTYRIQRPDGEIRWVRDRFSWQTNEAGDVTTLLGVVSDITEQKRRELTLEQHRAITQNINDIVLTIDENSRIQSVNPAVEAVLGYDPDTLVGEPLTTIIPSRFEKQHQQAMEQYLQTGTRTLDWEYIELPARHRDGHEVPLALSFSQFEHGDDRYFSSVMRDVTEQQRREQMLDDVLEVSQAFDEIDDRSVLFDELINAVERLFEVDAILIRQYESDSEKLVPSRVTARMDELLPEPPVYKRGEGVVGDVFQSGEPSVIDDLETTTGEAYDYRPFQSGLVVPLGEHGTISFGSTQNEAFDHEDAALVELLTHTATSALDRLQRETEMRQLNRIVDHVGEKVFLVDQERRITFTSEQFAGFLGYDRHTFQGKRLCEFMSADMVDECKPALQALVDGDDDSVTLEVEMQAATGRPTPVELTLAAIDDGGESTSIAGVVSDITALVETRSSLEAERTRFQKLFANLQDAAVDIAFVDNEPRIRDANDEFCDRFGYELDEILGENLNDIVIAGGTGETHHLLDERAAGGEQLSAEVVRATVDGRRDFLTRAIPYDEGADPRAFVVYTDITEQKERERYLKILHRLLRHNLRNDMTVVMGSAEMLASQLADDELAARAETLRRNAEQVVTLGEKAKEIEQIIGTRSDERTGIDLGEQLDRVVEWQQEEYPEAALNVEFDEPATLIAEGDETIQRAIRELVENAIVHGGGAAPKADITVHSAVEDGWVDIRISDPGSGIPDHEWGVVSGSEGIDQLTHSSGLGLWLARWITESNGGKLTRVDDGDGAVVSIRLQIVDSAS